MIFYVRSMTHDGRFWPIGFLQILKGLEAEATQDYESSSGSLRGPPPTWGTCQRISPADGRYFGLGFEWLPSFITDNVRGTVSPPSALMSRGVRNSVCVSRGLTPSLAEHLIWMKSLGARLLHFLRIQRDLRIDGIIRESEIAKHEIIKAEFDIFALRKTRSMRTKAPTNEPGQRHSNKNIKPDEAAHEKRTKTRCA